MGWAVARGRAPISAGALAAFGVGGLTLLLAACSPRRRGVCLGSGVLCVEWNEQPDQDWAKLDAFVVACLRTLGRAIHGPVTVVFVPDDPIRFDTDHRGAWFDSGTDTIYVKYIDDLWRSEICHEILHRELWLETGNADRKHSSAEWDKFCGGGYLVCR